MVFGGLGIAAALGVMGSWVATKLTLEVARAIFDKALLYALFTIVLPLVLWNLLHKILFYFMGKIQNTVGDGVTSMILDATGLLAWVLDVTQIPLALSIIVSALMMRWTLNIMTLRP